MQPIPLKSIPNQSFTVSVDGNQYAITLRTIGDITFATVAMNGTTLVSCVRCMPLRPIVPYQYLEEGGGNFAFNTPNDELPNYANFETTHTLIYASAAELAALRSA